jgi:hypothetical protein
LTICGLAAEMVRGEGGKGADVKTMESIENTCDLSVLKNCSASPLSGMETVF